jgi:stearoyl-CoA desaturase (delta-9 desaturase)
MYIRLFEMLGLAKVRRVARAPEIAVGKQVVDMETVKAVIGHRMHVLANYARDVIKPVTRTELCADEGSCRKLYRRAKKLLVRDQARLDEAGRRHLADILHRSQTLATVHQYRQQLQAVWERRASSQEALLHALQEWCQRAEATGIKALEDFAQRLRGYMPAVQVV